MLSELKAQREALLAGQSTTLYNTVSSGYFYGRSYVDGLEAVFSSKSLEDLTPEGLEELKDRDPVSMPAAYAVGKMAYTSRWYLAISFSAGAEEVLDVGDAYVFLFPENADKELTLQCVELTAGATGEILAVFTSDEVPSDFRYLRVQAVEITVDTCTGYYVPETALHTVDGAEGVYIFKDSTVYFRKVLVLYRGDGYIIAREQGDLGKEYLNLYDIMVTYGKDLYEGRVYR